MWYLVLSTAEAPAWPASCLFHAYATTAPSGQTNGMWRPHELLLDLRDSVRTPDSSSFFPEIQSTPSHPSLNLQILTKRINFVKKYQSNGDREGVDAWRRLLWVRAEVTCRLCCCCEDEKLGRRLRRHGQRRGEYRRWPVQLGWVDPWPEPPASAARLARTDCSPNRQGSGEVGTAA